MLKLFKNEKKCNEEKQEDNSKNATTTIINNKTQKACRL